MVCEKNVRSFCCEDISTIENYDKAMADTEQVWDCHHKAEILPCGRYSIKELRAHGLYYHRPACELIFLTHRTHMQWHRCGISHSQETKQRISEAKRGKRMSDVAIRKMSESLKGRATWMKGKHHTEETRRKMSESHKGKPNNFAGKHHSEETRRKISASNMGNTKHLGKPHSEESKRRMSEAHSGTRWFNNGERNVVARECPEGFVLGKLKKEKR